MCSQLEWPALFNKASTCSDIILSFLVFTALCNESERGEHEIYFVLHIAVIHRDPVTIVEETSTGQCGM
jgi:hypothetical protein